MARKYRRSRRVVQQQYRARRAKYEQYLARTKDETPKSFSEWNDPYRQNKFLRKEYKIYQERFEKRIESSRVGFYDPEEISSFKVFKDTYLMKRNDLRMDVEEGKRERVGSVVNEIINDQAYELSSNKAKAIADYLMREEGGLLAEKGLAQQYIDDEGKVQYALLKPKKLELLIREGSFVKEEVGLWDEITDYYKLLRDQGYSADDAKHKIGQTYFNSGPKKKK